MLQSQIHARNPAEVAEHAFKCEPISRDDRLWRCPESTYDFRRLLRFRDRRGERNGQAVQQETAAVHVGTIGRMAAKVNAQVDGCCCYMTNVMVTTT